MTFESREGYAQTLICQLIHEARHLLKGVMSWIVCGPLIIRNCLRLVTGGLKEPQERAKESDMSAAEHDEPLLVEESFTHVVAR